MNSVHTTINITFLGIIDTAFGYMFVYNGDIANLLFLPMNRSEVDISNEFFYEYYS